jgi:hypothetical protein
MHIAIQAGIAEHHVDCLGLLKVAYTDGMPKILYNSFV